MNRSACRSDNHSASTLASTAKAMAATSAPHTGTIGSGTPYCRSISKCRRSKTPKMTVTGKKKTRKPIAPARTIARIRNRRTAQLGPSGRSKRKPTPRTVVM